MLAKGYYLFSDCLILDTAGHKVHGTTLGVCPLLRTEEESVLLGADLDHVHARALGQLQRLRVLVRNNKPTKQKESEIPFSIFFSRCLLDKVAVDLIRRRLELSRHGGGAHGDQEGLWLAGEGRGGRGQQQSGRKQVRLHSCKRPSQGQ